MLNLNATTTLNDMLSANLLDENNVYIRQLNWDMQEILNFNLVENTKQMSFTYKDLINRLNEATVLFEFEKLIRNQITGGYLEFDSYPDTTSNLEANERFIRLDLSINNEKANNLLNTKMVSELRISIYENFTRMRIIERINELEGDEIKVKLEDDRYTIDNSILIKALSGLNETIETGFINPIDVLTCLWQSIEEFYTNN